MSDIRFDDPHIRGRATLGIDDHQVMVPAMEPDEAEAVAASVRVQADDYYRDGRDPFVTMRAVLARWADPADPLRREALPVLAALTGFSQESIARFGLWPLSRLRLDALDLETLRGRLVELVTSGEWSSFTRWGDGLIRAHGTPELREHPRPSLVLHSLAGNVVGTMWMSLMFGLGGRAGQVLKLPSDDPVSFLYLLRSVEQVDPELRRTVACGYYPGGSDTQRHALAGADVVFALGSDATMQLLQDEIDRVSPSTRLLAHGQKIGFQIVAGEYAREDAAELVAWGASACDGNACFSPANVYVERGGALSPHEFAEAVAEHMTRIAEAVPPKRSLRAAERIGQYRQRQLQRRLLGERVTLLRSRGTDCTVVVDEDDPLLAPTCQERTIVVKPVDAIDEVPACVRHLGRNLQTVGIAVESERLLDVADDLAEVGATNIKMLGTEYMIGLDEPHDGIFDALRLTMSDGLRWSHLTFSDTDRALADALSVNRAATDAALGIRESSAVVS